MRTRNLYILCLILFCTSIYLLGCSHATAGKYEETPEVKRITVQDSYTVTWEVNEDTGKENVIADSNTGEVITDEIMIDIDENGIMDFAQLLEREDGSVYIKITFNCDTIFTYEWKEIKLIAIDLFEYHDFDGDGKGEIFVTVQPMVNSMPLLEVMVLKEYKDKWKMMDIPFGETEHNEFPITITKGEEEFEFIVTEEIGGKQVTFDASSYYIDKEEGGPDSVKGYLANEFLPGDIVGHAAAWGIWEAWTEDYEGRDCIVVKQGLHGVSGKFNPLGEILVYYVYDEDGDIEVLDLVHIS